MFQNAYDLFAILAYIFASLVYFYHARAGGRPSREILFIGFAALLGSLFGAKIFHTIFEAEGHALADGQVAGGIWDLLRSDPWHWARLFDPGRVLFGALLGASLAAILALRIQKTIRPLQYADFFALALPGSVAIGRLGCYYAGCCFGQPTTLSWLSVSYAGPLAELGPLLPVQLFESAFGWVCLLYLSFQARKRHGDGTLFFQFVIAYSIFRFFIEYLRGDLERGLWCGQLLSTSQLLSLAILLACGAIYWIELDWKVWAKLS